MKSFAKTRSHSPTHKQTKKLHSPDVAETAAADTNITTTNAPQTSRKYKNLKPTKREELDEDPRHKTPNTDPTRIPSQTRLGSKP